MNGTQQVLDYAEDVSLIGDDIRTIEKNENVLLNACKDTGLAVNSRKTKYMEIGRHRGMMANEQIKLGNNSYEKVKTFKYLSSPLTNQNTICVNLKQEIHIIIQYGSSQSQENTVTLNA